jgi:hypothetical protein
MGHPISKYADMTPLQDAKWNRQYAIRQLRKPYVKNDDSLRGAWEKHKAEAETKIRELGGN